jgi:hypothetical protein
MNNDFKTSVEKLVADGCHGPNWITYRDRMLLGDRFPWHIRTPFIDDCHQGAMLTIYCRPSDVINAMMRRCHMIASSVSNAIFNKIRGKKTKDILAALKAQFERHTTQDLVDLKQRVKLTRHRDNDDVREHFDRPTNMREQLSSMDKSMPDAKYALILLPPYQLLQCWAPSPYPPK